MTFFSPLALGWLLAIPVLVWLWRFASTRHQIRVASLIPFEHLTKRSPRRRRRVVVNWLFWLQLVALAVIALALAQPAIHRRATTTLVILDTSASMGAEGHGGSPWDRARRALNARAARKGLTEQWFIMATAPAEPLTPQPTSEQAAIARAIESTRAQPLSGNLSTAARLGKALLGGDPDRILIVTDEPRPSEPLPGTVEWVSVGQPRANVGIVGVDAQGAFCGREEPRVIVTVQNFSREKAAVTLSAFHDRSRLSEVREELVPGDRRAMTLAFPASIEGAVELRLSAPNDGLEADNRARVRVHSRGPMPVVLRVASAPLARTVSRWLSACEGLAWSAEAAPNGPSVLVTDGPPADGMPSLSIAPPRNPQPSASRWIVSTDHPIGAYLSPLDVVSAAIDREPDAAVSGTPVIWALVQGRRIPVVTAEERAGGRRVVMRVDPSITPQATPLLLSFYNSLRWLMGDGRPAEDNFIDPLESNLLTPASTWRSPRPAETGARARPPVWHPLAPLLLWVLLLLLVGEWWLYTRKKA